MEKIYLQAIGIWLLFAAVANINGLIRNYVYGPKMDELTAHQISCFTGITMFFVVMYLWLRYTGAPYTSYNIILICIAFLFATIAFEFLFGHFVIGHSWEKLLHDYNILKGRLWSLVLAWTAIGPYVIAKYVLGKF